MRKAIKETTVYKFEELSEQSQQKALSALSDINVDYDWWDCTYEDAKTIGLKITGFDLDRGSYCKGDFVDDAEDVAKAIMKEHGDTCDTYKTAKSYLKDLEDVRSKYPVEDTQEFCDAKDDLDAEFLKSILEDYRIMLQNEYEYFTSEEQIIETIKANDYEFTVDGKIYH